MTPCCFATDDFFFNMMTPFCERYLCLAPCPHVSLKSLSEFNPLLLR